MATPRHDLGLYRGTRVAVLGAAGFVGRWVARALYQHGAQVALLVRDPATAGQAFARYGVVGEVSVGDAADPYALSAFLRAVRPVVTFNCVGYGVDRRETDADTAHRVNVGVVANLCEAVEEVRDREWPGHDVIHLGTVAEYGAVDGRLTPDCDPRPTTLYGRTKLAGTRLLTRACLERGIRGVTARLFAVYGPGEHNDRLLPSLLKATRTGRPIDLTSGTQERDFTLVEDAAEGLLRLGLVGAAPGEVVNLATGKQTSVRRFAEAAADVLGLSADRLRFGRLPDRPDDLPRSAASVDGLRELTGWLPPTPIADGIRRTAAFLALEDSAPLLDRAQPE